MDERTQTEKGQEFLISKDGRYIANVWVSKIKP